MSSQDTLKVVVENDGELEARVTISGPLARYGMSSADRDIVVDNLRSIKGKHVVIDLRGVSRISSWGEGKLVDVVYRNSKDSKFRFVWSKQQASQMVGLKLSLQATDRDVYIYEDAPYVEDRHVIFQDASVNLKVQLAESQEQVAKMGRKIARLEAARKEDIEIKRILTEETRKKPSSNEPVIVLHNYGHYNITTDEYEKIQRDLMGRALAGCREPGDYFLLQMLEWHYDRYLVCKVQKGELEVDDNGRICLGPDG